MEKRRPFLSSCLIVALVLVFLVGLSLITVSWWKKDSLFVSKDKVGVIEAALAPAKPVYAAAAGLISGAPLALAVHIGKAKNRLLSTLGTGGLGSPVLSVLEDFAAVTGSVLALVVTLLAVLAILAGAFVTWRIVTG